MAKRRPSIEEVLQTSVLADRLILTVGFIEDVETFPSGPQLRAVIEDASRRVDIRSLRLIGRDITEMTRALTSEHQSELAQLLREALGVDFQEEADEVKRAVNATLACGCIRSERERQRLECYIEWLQQVGGDPTEIAAVTELLRAG